MMVPITHQLSTIASWRWFVRMAQRGKDGTLFPTGIATFAARAANSGRSICGQEKAEDVLSPVA